MCFFGLTLYRRVTLHYNLQILIDYYNSYFLLLRMKKIDHAESEKIIYNRLTRASPSGKALAFQANIRQFESGRPLKAHPL